MFEKSKRKIKETRGQNSVKYGKGNNKETKITNIGKYKTEN